MKLGDLYSFFQDINETNIILLFKGALSQETLVQMGDSIHQQNGIFKSELRKSFAIFIELAQNIMHYSYEREMIDGKNVGVGNMIFEEESDCFRIISGNKITNEDCKNIVNKLDTINQASVEELKQLYKEQRRKSRKELISAGLGLIEIARKSGEKIGYEINIIDDNISFFSMNVTIKKV